MTINHQVLRLRRVALGKINIKDLKIGEYRNLTIEELEYLKNI